MREINKGKIKDCLVGAFVSFIVIAIGFFLVSKFAIKYWLFSIRHFRNPTRKEMMEWLK
jgi:hypothetical protein